MIRALLGISLAGMAAGGGARAMVGARQFLRSPGPPAGRTPYIPESISVPVPSPQMAAADAEEEELAKFAAAEPFRKLAQALSREKSADLGATVAGLTPQPVLDAMPNISNSGHPLKSWYGMPAALGAGALSIGGGWSLLDALLKSRRKAEVTGDVDDAKTEFQKALAAEYNAAMMAKNAEADPLAEAYDTWQEKVAKADVGGTTWGQQATDWTNTLAGLYLTTALGLGGTAAYGSYQWTKNRSNQALIRKALEARQRAQAVPQPLYAVPTGDLSQI